VDAGDQGLTAPPAHLVVGRIGRPHGLRGEVRVEVMTDFPERRFAPGSRLLAGDHDGPGLAVLEVGSVRPHGSVLLVRFQSVASRESAAQLNGLRVWIPLEEAAPLAADAYYEHELVGCAVATADGAPIGRVTGLLETGAADVLYVLDEATQRERLVPLIGAVVLDVDLAARRITIDPLPGLLD
jgi:16S rRNA processing protein RimM